MKNQLQNILNQLDNKETNRQELAYEALAIIKEILAENPNDIDMLILRMRLNADIFENSSEIIHDASFIIKNDQFKKEKMIGYDWLFWVYHEVLAIPEKAIEIIEEQLVEIYSLFDKKYEKDRNEGELLNKLAQLKFDNHLEDEAFSLWEKSFDKYPYIHHRNSFVGIQLLKQQKLDKAKRFLVLHFDWYNNIEDGSRLEYGKILKKLYDNKKLENQPDLIGLLFNIIRNEEAYFKLFERLDFYEKYFPELEKYALKFPNNSLLWTAVSNMYLLDLTNYEKAFEAFKQLAETDDFFRFSTLKRAMKAAKKSGNDFFEISFHFQGSANDNYSSLTELSDAVDKSKKKKKKKKFADLAIAYGKIGYDKFYEYLVEGKGLTVNNHPHIYAMLCNNYANAITEHADLFYEKEEKYEKCERAGNIHMEGYKISPFRENLSNAGADYYAAHKWDKAIECYLEAIKKYSDEVDPDDIQNYYWFIISSAIKKNSPEEAKHHYLTSKKRYHDYGAGAIKATKYFAISTQDYFCYRFEVSKAYKDVVSDADWLWEQKIMRKKFPLEYGIAMYAIGNCHSALGNKKEAVKALRLAVELLQEAEFGFYYDKSLDAAQAITKLGEDSGHNYEHRSPNFIKKIWYAIIKPFQIIALLIMFVFYFLTGIRTEKSKGSKRK